jgi:hypothetical protein
MWWKCSTLRNCCATIILQQFDESSCNEAQYVAKQNKIGRRNVKTYAQQNGFGPTFFHKMLSLVKGTVQSNKFDLTAIKNAINRI